VTRTEGCLCRSLGCTASTLSSEDAGLFYQESGTAASRNSASSASRGGKWPVVGMTAGPYARDRWVRQRKLELRGKDRAMPDAPGQLFRGWRHTASRTPKQRMQVADVIPRQEATKVVVASQEEGGWPSIVMLW
jgi:hypothetical protein